MVVAVGLSQTVMIIEVWPLSRERRIRDSVDRVEYWHKIGAAARRCSSSA
jgi:hypothetical protein